MLFLSQNPINQLGVTSAVIALNSSTRNDLQASVLSTTTTQQKEKQ
jgi:hypothetical protein